MCRRGGEVAGAGWSRPAVSRALAAASVRSWLATDAFPLLPILLHALMFQLQAIILFGVIF